MNILIISHMYPSTFNKMSGIFVHKQVKKLVELGCNVKVICPVPKVIFPMNILNLKWKGYYKIPDRDFIDGIEIYYPRYIEFPKGYSFNKSGTRMYKGIKNIVYKLNNSCKFDLVHSHVALPDGDCGITISACLKIPHIVTIHGQDFQCTIKRNRMLKKTVLNVLDKSDKVITVSNKLKNIVKDDKSYNKIEVINNGIDIEDNILNSSSITDDIDILSVSNLIKTKGIDINIEAVNILTQKYPKLKYYIIGDGEEKKYLKSMVEKYNLSNNIFFLGKLNHNRVMEYMSKCNIFSLPSWKEGFGVVYIEAMLQGKPVIGVKGEGIEDVILHKKNGFLIEPNNVKDLVDVLEYLLTNKKYSKIIGNNARNTVINDFTWTNTAKEILKIYKNVMENYKVK